MLKKIICDRFIQKEMAFHKGLNAVVGDDDATNSIGKSISLMIIDFAFGGEDYIHKNKDVVSNVGRHEFKFIFEFAGSEYFFKRDTSNYKSVAVCNRDFVATDYISSSEFNKFLQDKYDCSLEGLSFRDIVGRFFRVYGKENLNEKKPIQYFDKETTNVSIRNLLMLFDKYRDIQYLDNEVLSARERKNVLSSAMKKELIPNVNKSIYFNNKSSISNLENRLQRLKKEAIDSYIDIKAVISEDVILLREHKNELRIRLNVLKNRKRRITLNIDHKIIPFKKELDKLKEYFPDFDSTKVAEVETFHAQLTNNLKYEMIKTQRDIETEIEKLEVELKNIDLELEERLSIKDAPKIAVDSLINIATEIKQLSEANRYYETEQVLDTTIKKSSKELRQERERALAEITSSINNKMATLNARIYSDGRRPPTLTITGNSYRFDRFEDTGTGTAYVSLITYDLSILSLTCLPALIHDLPLIKNIEDHAFSNIVKIYTESNKQIFISIDKLPSYSEDTQKSISENTVLKLSKNKLLFGINWKKTSS